MNAIKKKRTGPCDNCSEKESTQWRLGPPHAPTLCNACGVHWGRKKKLPQRGPPQPAGRAKREREQARALSPPALEEASDSYDDSEAAEMLIVLASTLPAARPAKHRRHSAARARAGGEPLSAGAGWVTPRRSLGAARAATSSGSEDGSVGGRSAGEHTPAESDSVLTHRDCAPATFAAAAGGAPDCGRLVELTTQQMCQRLPSGMGKLHEASGHSTGGESKPLADYNLVLATAAAAQGVPQTVLEGMPVWPLTGYMPLPPPTGFDMFRADLQALNPAAGWSDARRVWETLPADVTNAYQLSAQRAVPGMFATMLPGCSPVALPVPPPGAPLVGAAAAHPALQVAACLAN